MAEENEELGGGGGEGGGTPPAFHDTLPEDIRGHEALKDFKDVGGLAKSFIDTQAMVGNSLRIPGEDAKPEDWGAFYEKLGRPKDADGYELSKWEQPEGFKASEVMEQSFRGVSHELGLTPKQAEGLNKWYGEQINILGADLKGQKANSAAQSMKALEKDWGQAHEAKVDRASQTFLKFAGEDQIAYLEKTGLGNDPELLRVWDKVADVLEEHGLFDGDGSLRGSLTPAQAKEEIAKLQKDKDFMAKYHNKEHAEHKSSVDEMEKLFKLAYPE